MEFQEYIPSKLDQLVISIFERKVTSPMRVQMLPDNTVSLIFYIGEKIDHAHGKKVDSRAFNPTEYFCFLTGLHTEPLFFDMEGLHSIGIRMMPSAIRAFWGIPVEHFQDRVLDWELGEDLAYIEDHIRGASTFMERAHWIENYFAKKLESADLTLAPQLNRLILRMERDVKMGKRPDIEQYSGYSKMHTHRIFKDWLGLTPGKALRYQQFLSALNLLDRSDWSLTQIGLECGFYDQSHFIRVFKEFAKMTPGQYQKLKTPIPGILPW